MQTTRSEATPAPSAAELQKEIRALKRKLSLAEANLTRARYINAAQERVESIMNASMKKEIQFFKLVLEHSTNILLLLDFDGRFAYSSQTFLDVAGIASFGMIGGRHYAEVLRQIVPGDVLERFSGAVNSAVSQIDTVTLEEQIDFCDSGDPRTFSIMVTPMTGESGESIGIMALFSDITEINNALEAARHASVAKSDFLANMSHEIRTPLNAVLGMATIAQNSDDKDKIHYCLSKISDSSTHLLGVINDILDMSKIETNHFELSYSEFSPGKMLLRIVDVMRFKIEEKHIAFELYCDPDLPYMISSDEQRLAQVIMNLLSNAVKFTPENGRVTLSAEAESFDGDMYTLRVSISDSGIGISDEQKPRIFKAFSQADSSISRKFGGTGLGLVISQKIINMLGGDITFDSVAGEGTTFTFRIKARACRTEPARRPGAENINMLAVDGDESALRAMEAGARKLGLRFSAANNAREALEIHARHPQNLILLDWNMPQGGAALARELSAMPGEATLAAVLPTADWSDVEGEAKNAGVSEFISKPVLLPVLEAVLDKLCGGTDSKSDEYIDDYSTKTVLLADDIEINREIIISMLEHTGVTVVPAENGLEAVQTFTATPEEFDLIFMDVQMPEMDGFDATRRIRASGSVAARTVPIVAMTANVFKEDVERCLASGMNDHIGKPVDMRELLEKTRLWMNA